MLLTRRSGENSHNRLLWSPSWLVSSAAALALLGLGALAFAGGYASFRRSDA